MTIVPFPLPSYQQKMMDDIPGYDYRPCQRLIDFYDDLSHYLNKIWEGQR